MIRRKESEKDLLEKFSKELIRKPRKKLQSK